MGFITIYAVIFAQIVGRIQVKISIVAHVLMQARIYGEQR